MTGDVLEVSKKDVARFFIAKQRLANVPHQGLDEKKKIMDVIESIKYLQIDPVSAVERSHFIILWSRIGNFNKQNLLDLIYEDRSLVESYVHAASISGMDDLPILMIRMKETRERYLRNHPEMKREMEGVKRKIEQNGPVYSNRLSELRVESTISGWGHERKVNLLLAYMHRMGEIAICGRSKSNQKLWELPENFYQSKVKMASRKIAEKITFMKSLEALGIASVDQIKGHYMPVGISNPKVVTKELLDESMITGVQISDDSMLNRKRWFICTKDVQLFKSSKKNWKPGFALISPFDNLIIDRKRTLEIFSFDSRMEIYVPKDKRKFGFYSMPFLYGDKLVGRIDPQLDRKGKKLKINSIHDEKNYFENPIIKRKLHESINSLARFTGATSVEIPDQNTMSGE